ncbi:hypothetical protein LINPERPRIM_LOCUS35272 [Linum perenne]
MQAPNVRRSESKLAL